VTPATPSGAQEPGAPPVAPPPEQPPDWARGATPFEAFLRGTGAVTSTPGLVLIAGSLGFGALVRDMGLGIGFAIWTSIVFYALPAQVVLADQIGRDASIWAAAFAVSLTAVRLMPMTVTLMPYLRDVKGRRWLELIAVHFIAVTAWIEGHARLGRLPEHLRIWHFIGFGLSFVLCTAGGAAAGYALAAVVPVAVSAALLFFTPAYFMLSLITTARQMADKLAIVLGVVIGPLVYVVAPGLDLLVAGLVGGTVAFLSGKPLFGRRR
jgi:predicted branched-subunit amino acid permease